MTKIPKAAERAERARLDAYAAKADLLETVNEIRHRTSPSNLAKTAGERAKDGAALGAEKARKELQQRPYAVGAVAVLAALIGARKLKKKKNERGVVR